MSLKFNCGCSRLRHAHSLHALASHNQLAVRIRRLVDLICNNLLFSKFSKNIFYTCHTSMDCFPEEYCTPQRFCCPISGLPTQIVESSDNAPLVAESSSKSARCPDESDWLRMCKTNEDCIFRDEICAEGKCCPSCKQRRTQVLTEMPKIEDFKDDSNDRALTALHIPQCNQTDTNYYHPMQCTKGTNECFCVTKFGRKISGLDINQKKVNCTQLRDRMDKANKFDSGRLRLNPKRKEVLVLNSTDDKGQQARKREDEEDFLELGRDGMYEASSNPSTSRLIAQQPTSPVPQEYCADPLREYKPCGSSCPISCATRTRPKCANDECQRGCFCRLPYVILDMHNPFTSRCVLPAECPMLPFTTDLNTWHGGFFPGLTTPQQHNQDTRSLMLPKNSLQDKCSDPLKNFQSCGSACPSACGQLRTPDCPVQCVAGCFCRAPYVLKEASDPNSGCILPQHCPEFREDSDCNEPNQIWSACVSKKCPRSCEEWLPFCQPDDCRPGCECRLPYVSLKKGEVGRNCVLPEQCSARAGITTSTTATTTTDIETDEKDKCQEPNKEYRSCASSCPLGCDNLELQLCTPCVAGCFCKNGYVFENSSNWRNSACVPISSCVSSSSNAKRELLKTEQVQDSFFNSPIQPTNSVKSGCPRKPADINGRSCDTDFECGFQQKCCASAPEKLNSSLLAVSKCTCLDSNTVWMECGSVCPATCQDTHQPNCPKICRPGCFCIQGYIKQSTENSAICVPSYQCPIFNNSTSTESTINSAKAEESRWSQNGRLLIRPDRRKSKNENKRIRITGELSSVSDWSDGGSLAIYQFSDTTINGCNNVGHPLQLNVLDEDENGFVVTTATNALDIAALPSFRTPVETSSIRVDKVLQWPDMIMQGTNPLIGHSVVLKSQARESEEKIIACAVLGIVPSC
uniref:Thyroglobulin type-1 domain-containing protein n=1 Tax=Ditylenchus dipsaci TaxID=166011 RepID=A0A915EDY6_9BILA